MKWKFEKYFSVHFSEWLKTFKLWDISIRSSNQEKRSRFIIKKRLIRQIQYATHGNPDFFLHSTDEPLNFSEYFVTGKQILLSEYVFIVRQITPFFLSLSYTVITTKLFPRKINASNSPSQKNGQIHPFSTYNCTRWALSVPLSKNHYAFRPNPQRSDVRHSSKCSRSVHCLSEREWCRTPAKLRLWRKGIPFQSHYPKSIWYSQFNALNTSTC